MHLNHLARLRPTRPQQESNVTDGMNRKNKRKFKAKTREATKQVLKLAKEQLKKHPIDEEQDGEESVEGDDGSGGST